MDRISALRNVEDALGAFEDGEIDLATLEERVVGVLRTYATDLDADPAGSNLAAFRVAASGSDEETVVVAADADQARERAAAITGADAGELDSRPL